MLKRGFVPHIVIGAALLLTTAAAVAQAPDEPAVTRRATDADLKWGACPDWMPKGCTLTVLHGDPAKNNADALVRLPGGSKVVSHYHTSAERMVLISGEMVVSYDGQKPITLKAGSYAYGPAKRLHSVHCTSKSPCVLFIAFELPVDSVPVKAK